jgi:hypothetical protein
MMALYSGSQSDVKSSHGWNTDKKSQFGREDDGIGSQSVFNPCFIRG